MALSLADRIEAVERAYEFMLAYAGQGKDDAGDPAASEIRATLTPSRYAIFSSSSPPTQAAPSPLCGSLSPRRRSPPPSSTISTAVFTCARC
jgi:hypothetical protein